MSRNPYEATGGQVPGVLGEPEDASLGPPDAEAALARRTGRAYTSQMKRANIFMAALFVAAGVLVYGLTLRKGPSEASAEQKVVESQVDSAIMRIAADPRLGQKGSAPGGMSGALLKRFYGEVSDRQIPLDQLKKNPFRFVLPTRADLSVSPSPGDLPATGERRPDDGPTRQEVLGKLQGLCLQAIQRGEDGAVAILSNNLLTEGQKIEFFTVKRITEKTVVLTWKDEEFVLNMP